MSAIQTPAWRASVGMARPTYDTSKFKSFDVGPYKLRISGDTATLDYTVDGRSGSIPLMRYSF